MSASLIVQQRPDLTKSERKRLRQEGFVPGSVYGKTLGSVSVSVNKKELEQLLRKNTHGVIDMTMPDGGKQPVMIQQLQKEPLSGELLHIDFHLIRMDEPVRSMIPVEITGEAQGVKEGGIMQVRAHELEVKCLPRHLPSSIAVDVSGLGIGDNFTVSQLNTPQELEILSEADEVIVSILAPQKNEEEEPPAAEAEGEPANGEPE
ncbi:50S ribosomal protein L25/general stress protein Ctc [Paenibacillus sp. J2TS4]|uniref:50S ribosomal protein L25/general stress protein Ctc n=1 Tax=Paenibacillus sp. J2TS4 TaxID=2807194 RepID=UPI001B1AD8B9|nr:50S ribosomal protein L25/general stress protein Ctc [Paenibacillus sp. J2TS4]GIP36334.1 50S ribosomal protein L25 [Paenibacillus sp. J2TS4]